MKAYELLDLTQSEPEALAVSNEAHSLQVRDFVGSVAGRRAQRGAQQAFALVEPECLDIDASLSSEFANSHGSIVNPIPGYKVSGSNGTENSLIIQTTSK